MQAEYAFGFRTDRPLRCEMPAYDPQAWAAGTLPFLLTTLLGFEPDAFAKRLRIGHPILPKGLDRLDVKGLRVGRASVDLVFQKGRTDVDADVIRIDGELEVQVDKGHNSV